MNGADRQRRPDPASERSAVPVSVILLLAAIAALAYAVLGATVTDPDTYGTVPVPSDSLVELPGRETEISLARPAGAPAALPADLRVTIADGTGIALRVDPRGGEAYERDGLSVRPMAAAFPPADGTYRVEVTGDRRGGCGSGRDRDAGRGTDRFDRGPVRAARRVAHGSVRDPRRRPAPACGGMASFHRALSRRS